LASEPEALAHFAYNVINFMYLRSGWDRVVLPGGALQARLKCEYLSIAFYRYFRSEFSPDFEGVLVVHNRQQVGIYRSENALRGFCSRMNPAFKYLFLVDFEGESDDEDFDDDDSDDDEGPTDEGFVDSFSNQYNHHAYFMPTGSDPLVQEQYDQLDVDPAR